MSKGERDFAALRYEELYAKATTTAGYRERPDRTLSDAEPSADLRTTRVDRSARADERAAKVMGTSGRAVQQAKTIRRDAPDLERAVRAGELGKFPQ